MWRKAGCSGSAGGGRPKDEGDEDRIESGVYGICAGDEGVGAG